MAYDPKRSSKRVLEPVERISEFLFGVIMVLIATCAFRATGADRGNVRTMLGEAVGCNVAWGIIDAFFFLLACLGARGQGTIVLNSLRKTSDPDTAKHLIGSVLPPLIESVFTLQESEPLAYRLSQLPETSARPWLTREDWIGALAVFLLVFLAIFPLVVPFILIENDLLALRISNATAICLMFLAGHSFGRFTGSHPWRAGLVMVVLGLVVVGIAVLLGG